MPWPAEIFLALRYLRPKRTFISIITLLSVLGPAIGVAVLIIVMSVMSGFDRDIKARILSMQAHLHVTPAFGVAGQNVATLENPLPILAKMRELGVAGAPIIETPILLQHRKELRVKFLRGIDPDLERTVTDIAGKVKGRFDIKEGEALVGEEMALDLGVGLGDTLLIHSPHKLTRNIEWQDEGGIRFKDTEDVYLPEEVEIVGLFSFGLYDYDSSMLFIHIDQAADLCGVDWGTATAVQARCRDPFNLGGETQALRAAFPGLRVTTWQEANEQLFGALRVEKNLMLLVLFFIVLVAAFCIAGTLITVVIQKTRDIGVMKAVGLTAGTVARVFLLQGILIGVLGTAIGTGIGLLLVHHRNGVAGLLGRVMGVEIFPKELYHLSQIPAQINRGDVVFIVGMALLICVLASLLPALYASCLSPARALQDDV
ncbi:MAG: Lipoprotein-releasing system transmembrane protein LolC [Lentisphaerae bacterium ADurb.BinA184]|nr:MAG: Lipoprotein-releasing system transmembrane protein LolC [Lentisphaerae bacterium ADurb.BinA184]